MKAIEKLVPELRFPGFKKNWELKKLKTIFFNSRTKGGDASLTIFSVTQDRGLVPRESLNRKMPDCANVNDNLQIQPKDIVYNMMRMWQGAVGLSYWDGLVSPAYIVLRPTKETCSEFFINFFSRSRSLYLFTAYSYGLTKDRLRLYYKDFGSITLAIPAYLEQQKIASFISVVDKKIEKLTWKKELLEQYKKGVMQKIFFQEVRFKNENGMDYPDWKEMRLGELVTFNKGKGLSKADVKISGEFKCIRYGELFTLYKEVIEKINSSTDYVGFASKVGDILMPTSDVTPFGLATASCLNTKDVIIGGDINVLRPKIKLNSNFLSYLINFDKKKIIRLVTGTTVKHIYAKDIRHLIYRIPYHTEQQKIANFLSTIDKKIKAVQTQLTQTQAFKKGLLQKMFV